MRHGLEGRGWIGNLVGDVAIVDVRLVSPDLRLLNSAVEGRSALAHLLGCELAEGWEVFPEALRRTRDLVASDPASVRWGPRLVVVVDEASMLAGWGGFKGPPRNGVVEIRYAIAAQLRGRGIATAAVQELVRDAFNDPEVTAVVAHTDAAPNPSARVLAKAGFACEGEVPDDEIGLAWRFRHQRAPVDIPYDRSCVEP